MNFYMVKVLQYVFLFIFVITIILFEFDANSSSIGITGLTRKDPGSVGCVCHGEHIPTDSIEVLITGPDSVAVNDTVLYQVKITGGIGIKGGFDLASWTGDLDTAYTDTTVRKQNSELTHKMPKSFFNDTATWTVKYKAPPTPQYDTLYAVANSTNNNGIEDTVDLWNFSENFPIKVYYPIGIINTNGIAASFHLYQNYPNPFNPDTKIKFEISYLKNNTNANVELSIYDIQGKRIEILVSSKLKPGIYEFTFNAAGLASGIYFYRLTADKFNETKKMILIR